MTRDSIVPREQSVGEEIANGVTHGLGLLAAVVAVPLLVARTARQDDDVRLVIGSAIFGVTLVMLYLSSTLYHALPHGRAKHTLRTLDHSAIYLLIAGTYTPFLLGALRGPWGWTLLAIVWTLAAAGIVAKWSLGFRYPRLSTVLYLGMGWLAIVAIRPFVTHVSVAGLVWLLAGGLCYTAGVAFYSTDTRLRYGHALWHLFVLGGSVCHFVAVAAHAQGRV